MSENSSKNRKDIKKQRNMKYFLEAAKEIVEKEGVENVSVRKVADIAGYSYPSLYNYFEDLNELLWEVRNYMILDLVENFRKSMVQPVNDVDGIKMVFKAYIAYYLENPNTFRFFYFHQLHKPGRVLEDAVQEPDYNAMWGETFKGLVIDGVLQMQDIEVVAKTIIYAVQGMLNLYFSNNGNLQDNENIYKDLEIIVDYLLKARQ